MQRPRITATAARKAARQLGPDHPAVRHWRNVATRRIARLCNADANPRTLGVPSRDLDRLLERAAARLIEAASA